MKEDYKATPEQWGMVERWADRDTSSSDSCILELRARIEALEAERVRPLAGTQPTREQTEEFIDWADPEAGPWLTKTLPAEEALAPKSQSRRGLRTVTVVGQRLTREEYEAQYGPVEPAPEPAAAPRCGCARRPTVAELSPDAQAVWDAYEGSGVLRGPALAAALRAAADQVVPGSRYQPIFMGTTAEARWEERQSIRRRMLALAAELDGIGGNTTSQEDFNG